ncbi:unnamed protein product, partial [Meganyctiphanes norvegica]
VELKTQNQESNFFRSVQSLHLLEAECKTDPFTNNDISTRNPEQLPAELVEEAVDYHASTPYDLQEESPADLVENAIENTASTPDVLQEDAVARASGVGTPPDTPEDDSNTQVSQELIPTRLCESAASLTGVKIDLFFPPCLPYV